VLDPWRDSPRLENLPGAIPDLVAPPSGCRFHPRCSRAMPKCAAQEPPHFAIGDGYRVKCWLYEPAMAA
jgi:oligopeptide/dipeptide ABC transporter ATP-binding protein